jgi:hypothetical protein
MKQIIYETTASVEVTELKLLSNSLFKRLGASLGAGGRYVEHVVWWRVFKNLLTLKNAHMFYNEWHVNRDAILLFLGRLWGRSRRTSWRKESGDFLVRQRLCTILDTDTAFTFVGVPATADVNRFLTSHADNFTKQSLYWKANSLSDTQISPCFMESDDPLSCLKILPPAPMLTWVR